MPASIELPRLLSVLVLATTWQQTLALPTDPAADWMVNPAPFRARITEHKATGELTLDNGLARRVIRLSPNAATVGLVNLTTGEHLLRGIAPEARITINGTDFPIGGLEGQPIQNYLKEEWLDTLRPVPGSYQLSGWEEQPMSERLKWKKRPEWLARDYPWPPPGKHLVLHFQPPASPVTALAGPVLYQETFGAFAQPKPGWTITASKAHPRSSFSNEGKAGEIMAIADTSVFADRD